MIKEVTITIKLLVEDDQPCCDWIYESIYEQLNHDAGEAILEYNDDEPEVKMTDHPTHEEMLEIAEEREKANESMKQFAITAPGFEIPDYVYANTREEAILQWADTIVCVNVTEIKSGDGSYDEN